LLDLDTFGKGAPRLLLADFGTCKAWEEGEEGCLTQTFMGTPGERALVVAWVCVWGMAGFAFGWVAWRGGGDRKGWGLGWCLFFAPERLAVVRSWHPSNCLSAVAV